jgi:hypothetical protein
LFSTPLIRTLARAIPDQEGCAFAVASLEARSALASVSPTLLHRRDCKCRTVLPAATIYVAQFIMRRSSRCLHGQRPLVRSYGIPFRRQCHLPPRAHPPFER